MIMRFFKQLLNRSKLTEKTVVKPAENTEHNGKLDALVNSATHVSAPQLIALQQQAKKLDMTRRGYARASTTGSHRSRFRGRGMDYLESRLYQAGDDIRNMDWRVTARSGKPHIKLYQEERERPIVLLVDFNAGMFFGSTNCLKSVLAAKVAAMIAWSAATKGDRIGSLIINDSHHELAPKMGKRGVLALIRALVKYSDPRQGLQSQASLSQHGSLSKYHANAFNDELKRLRHIAKPGSLIYLISDFYESDDETDRHLQRLSQHNELQAIQIVDPLEMTPPKPNVYMVTDGDNVGVMNTRSKQTREHYISTFQTHHKSLQQLMSRHNIPLMQLSTADDLFLKLQQNFGGKKLAMRERQA